MLVLEYKIKAKTEQYKVIDEAIRTVQFVRNKCLRYWMDAGKEAKINSFALNKYSTELRNEFDFVKALNSMAVQASAERAWFAISRFYGNCKAKISGKKGFPASIKITVRLNTKPVDGRFIRQSDESLLPTRRESVNSSCWENGMFTPTPLKQLNEFA